MKNCTKLKFVYNTDYIEDFFLGGTLPYDELNQCFTHPTQTSYKLINEHEKFVVKRNLNGKTVGIIQCIYDAESLKQNLECRCSIIRGELPYNTSLGIPLKMLPQETELAILNLINDTPGVQSCTVLNSSIENRRLHLQLRIESNFGPLQITI